MRKFVIYFFKKNTVLYCLTEFVMTIKVAWFSYKKGTEDFTSVLIFLGLLHYMHQSELKRSNCEIVLFFAFEILFRINCFTIWLLLIECNLLCVIFVFKF